MSDHDKDENQVDEEDKGENQVDEEDDNSQYGFKKKPISVVPHPTPRLPVLSPALRWIQPMPSVLPLPTPLPLPAMTATFATATLT
jgi:hypothetical protein